MPKRREHGRRPREEERDPIADYKEWTDHRYDPGYFTGGRLPPGVRGMQKMFNARDKRTVLIIIVVVVAAALVARAWFG